MDPNLTVPIGCFSRFSLFYSRTAVGLWMYSSLDAIDGKQARRTGTSGPLGELFDHGCDALNLVVRNAFLLV
jgi:ethanolaminephosphotransferase